MNTWLLTLPLSGIVTGAILFRLLLQRMIKPTVRLGLQRIEGLLPRIESFITGPGVTTEVLKLAETHVDHFLRDKLPTAMPVVAMFVGDKTIAQFKSVFMEELKQLLPLFIQSYLGIALKPTSIEPMLEELVRGSVRRLSARAMMIGAAFGGIIGIVQCGVVCLFV